MPKAKNKLKIAVAMSGGVDSSVAAKLLKDQGHIVVGIFLHFWQEENPPQPQPKAGRPFIKGGNFGLSAGASARAENKCCSSEALLDAKRAACKIGIPLYTLNFAKIFKKQVVNNFLAEYAAGRTPNPCVRCNKLVKLGFLIKQAKKLGFDYVATGHYARLKREFSIFPPSPRLRRASNFQFSKNTNNKYVYKLYKAKDKNKDQSYFLYTLNQDELKRLLFPLGNYAKSQVRRMARKFKLPVAEKKESQEICFIPEKSHNEFLKRHLKLRPGLIKIIPLDKGGRRGIKLSGKASIPPTLPGQARDRLFIKGRVVGRHQGLPLYTIGQRKGIKIGGHGPFYAAKMDYKTNTLYVVDNSHQPMIYKSWLVAKNVNWLSGAWPKLPLKCRAVIRYHHEPAECVITKINKPRAFRKARGENNFKVKFSEPQRAITPGQSVVFYQGREVLGGGVIR